MKINLDFKLKESQNPNKMNNQEVFLSWFKFGLDKKNPKGVKGQMLRSINRLIKKIEAAIEENLDEVSLDETDKDLIKGAFSDDIEFPIPAVPFISLIQDEIENETKK